MGDNNTHARRLLLRAYEHNRMELQDTKNPMRIHFNAGKLMQTAELLRDCGHIGDDPQLQGDEWIWTAEDEIRRAIYHKEPESIAENIERKSFLHGIRLGEALQEQKEFQRLK